MLCGSLSPCDVNSHKVKGEIMWKFWIEPDREREYDSKYETMNINWRMKHNMKNKCEVINLRKVEGDSKYKIASMYETMKLSWRMKYEVPKLSVKL